MFTGGGIETLKKALDKLKEHCKNEGRNYDEIEKTILGSVYLGRKDIPDTMERQTRAGKVTIQSLKTADGVIDHIKELAELGVQQAIFNMRDPYNLKNLETFKDEIIPAVKDL